MIPGTLRVIQSNERGFPTAKGGNCWSGIKSFTNEEEKNKMTLRKTLFILKKQNGLKDLGVFESEYIDFREYDKKYVFEVTSTPKILLDQKILVHLMSCLSEKFAAVELVERLGRYYNGL